MMAQIGFIRGVVAQIVFFLSLLVVTQIIFNCVLKAAQIIFIRVYGVSDSFLSVCDGAHSFF